MRASRRRFARKLNFTPSYPNPRFKFARVSLGKPKLSYVVRRHTPLYGCGEVGCGVGWRMQDPDGYWIEILNPANSRGLST